MNKVFYISFCPPDPAFHYPVHSKSHLAQRLGDFINHTLTNRFALDNAMIGFFVLAFKLWFDKPRKRCCPLHKDWRTHQLAGPIR